MKDRQGSVDPLPIASVFSTLSPALSSLLDARCQFRDCSANERIYFPEDPCDGVYWVETGRVKVSRISKEGRALTLRHCCPGDMFGEDCMASCHQRRDHAESLAASRLRWMPASEFQDLLDSEVEFTRFVLEYVRHRACDMEEVFSETVFRPVSSRIAAGLLRLCRQESGEARTISITHQEVANLAGSTRETTTAVLHSLRKAGVVEIANRRVTVLDLDALRSVARQS